MPELPDIVVYLEALQTRILDQRLTRVQIASPFLLRTATPPINTIEGKKVIALRRLGKRICIGFEDELWLVLHLMIAGRLHWKSDVASGAGTAAKQKATLKAAKGTLAIFDFTTGRLSLTEAGTQRRASLHLVQGDEALDRFNAGGLEIFEIDQAQFASALKSENHTLKRSLTDPRLFSGIGNAYSDEILWHAQLSPVAMTQKLGADEIERLFNSTKETLTKWIELLRDDLLVSKSKKGKAGMSQHKQGNTVNSERTFPEKVTAFRPEMAVHGKYGKACPRCGNKVQRIRYASNETNYCPTCQTGGKLLADRALSRLLRGDWPRTAEELEDAKRDR